MTTAIHAGQKLGKIIVPLITPFHPETGDINYPVVDQLIEHLISNRYCDSIAVAGTTGEFNTLEYEEKVELFAYVKKRVGDRVPLVAGTGAASTREAIKLTLEAERLGYDVAMIVGPYYCKPTQEGIYQHYKAIADATDIPIMLYNIPIFTGMNIDPETVHRLAQIEQIVGIKDEAGINPTQMTDYRHATSDSFTIYNGDDIMVLCGLAQGAAGVVSGGSHLIGGQMREMIELFESGRNDEARVLHLKLDRLFKSFCPNGRIHPMPVLRAAVELTGIPVGPARSPLDRATEQEIGLVRDQLAGLGVL